MGAQTRTTGGGAATGTANDWNSFLRGQLTGQNTAQQQTGDMTQRLQQLGQNPLFSGISQQMQNQINQQQSNQQQPGQQTSAFQQAFNGMLGGQGNDVNGSQRALQQFWQMPQNQQAPQQSNPLLAAAGGQQLPMQQGEVRFSGQMPQNMAPPGNPLTQGGGPEMQMGGMPQFGGGGNAPPMYPTMPQQAGNQQLPTFANPYQNQQFVNPNTSQLPTNYGAGQTGMADLSGFGGIGPTNVNTSAGMGATGQSDYGAQLQQLLAQSQGMFQGANGGGGANAQAYNLAPAAAIDLNNPLVAAQEQGMDRARQIAVADQRARFGADGSGSLGTGAQVAEGTLNAEFAPRRAQFLQQSIQQQQANDLANRSLGANVGLANAGNDLQGQIATMQGALQGQGQANQFNSSLLNSQLSSALQGRGQDFNNQATNRGMDISQMGLGLNQAQGNQGAALTQQGQMLQSLLQNQGMGNAFGLNAFNANSNNQQQNNANSLNSSNMQNQFNLNNAGQMAQSGQGTNSLNLQSAMAGQNNLLQALGMGQQQNQFNSGQQADIMRMLFGAFGQSNQLGTPQAQQVTTPSPWGQALNAGLGLAGSWLGGGGGNPFSGMFGGGGNSQMPQMPNFGGFSPTTGNGGWRPGQPTYQPSWGR